MPKKRRPQQKQAGEAMTEQEAPKQAQKRAERSAIKPSSPFSTGFLQGIVIVLTILVIASAYIVGYQYGRMGTGGSSPAPTTTTQAAAAAPAQAAQPSLPPPPTVPKTTVPEADLFIMSYCPYGLQMQKAFVQVQELLGEKANMKVRWVSYAMHGLKEVQDNVHEYCIQKEQPEKFTAFERCFVEKTDYAACATAAGVDMTKVQSCYDATDAEFGIQAAWDDKASWLSGRYPKFAIDEADNKKYGVQGSPTFVLNGKQVSVSRSAEAVKQAICNAFTTPPKECDTVLNANQEQPGAGPIGAGTAPAAAAADCGA